MFSMTSDFKNLYLRCLVKNQLHEPKQHAYLKWLHFYLDFCQSAQADPVNFEQLDAFIERLKDLKWDFDKLMEAEHAVQVFYKLHMLCESKASKAPISPTQEQPKSTQITKPMLRKTQQHPKLVIASQTTPPWTKVFIEIEKAIHLRHYSKRTLKTYTQWAKRFAKYTQGKPLNTLTKKDVEAFLSHLASKDKISASTQNVAFNALLFLFRHGLKKDLGKLKDVVRVKSKPYIPVVLSRTEIELVFEQLNSPYTLVAKLLYGCGLRLDECLKLRLQDLNLDMEVLTVHFGKGGKSRTLPLPKILIPELRLQIETVIERYKQDIQADYGGVFLPKAIEMKYKNAAKELPWQWLFPAKQLTAVADDPYPRRFHLHATHVQKAIKKAVKQACILKRATAHTFRHSYATHLLQANYDLCTIQHLLGHSDIKTTMIYLQTAKTQTIKDPASPLDLNLERIS